MLNLDLSDECLYAHAENIWHWAWDRFYLPKTQLFYDCLTSLEDGRQFDFLPTPEEIQKQEPNPCGWGSGMEDSVISGGTMLAIICDRYAVTKEASLAEKAQQVFQGLYRCCTVHGVPGFVARSICPADGKSVYNNSSRDQYTHLVHGFWRYFHSPLADNQTKTRIAEVLVAVARYAEDSVTAETNYTLKMLNGKPAPMVCQMWNLAEIGPHEAARLPMIYAAAWDVTGEKHFLDMCNKYLHDSLVFSCQLWPWPYSAFALFQMACSLEVLFGVFPSHEERSLMLKASHNAAEHAQYNAMQSAKEFLLKRDVETTPFADWRTLPRFNNCGYLVPRSPFTIKGDSASETSRNAGEAALVQMMAPEFPMSELQVRLLKQAISCRTYERYCCYGTFSLMGAYWRMRLLGL